MHTTATLSPLCPATTLPRRSLSEMRPWRVTGIVRPAAGPARPITLTIWALGQTMAHLLADRQLDTLQLRPLGPLSVHQA